MNTHYRKNFAENLKRLRKNHGETQKGLSFALFDRADRPSTISAMENPGSGRQPTLDQVLQIADHYHVSVDSLFGRTAQKEFNLSLRYVCKLFTDLINTAGLVLTEKRNIDDLPPETPILFFTDENHNKPIITFLENYYKISQLKCNDGSPFPECYRQMLVEKYLEDVPDISLFEAARKFPGQEVRL